MDNITDSDLNANSHDDSKGFFYAVKCYKTGLKYYESDDYINALDSFQEALKILEKSSNYHQEYVVDILNNIANSCVDLGRYKDAFNNYKKALEMIEKFYGNQQSTAFAQVLMGIGVCHYHVENYSIALQKYEEAYHIMEKHIEENSVYFIPILNNMGQAYSKLEKYELAIRMFDRACLISRSETPMNIKDLGTAMHNISICYLNLGNLKKAEQYNTCALNMHSSSSDRSLSVALTLQMKASIDYKKGFSEKALDCFLKSYNIKESLLPKEHYLLANDLYSIGSCYLALNDNLQALDYFHKSYNIKKYLLSTSNDLRENILDDDLYAMGKCYHSTGQTKEALSCFEESYNMRKSFLSEGHYILAENLYMIGVCYMKLDQNVEALNCFLEWQKQNSFDINSSAYKKVSNFIQELSKNMPEKEGGTLGYCPKSTEIEKFLDSILEDPDLFEECMNDLA